LLKTRERERGREGERGIGREREGALMTKDIRQQEKEREKIGNI